MNVSKVMSSNKYKNSKPEILLRHGLWKIGLRGYRLHYKEIPGTPDITMFQRKLQFLFMDAFGIDARIATIICQSTISFFGKTSLKIILDEIRIR